MMNYQKKVIDLKKKVIRGRSRMITHEKYNRLSI